MVFPDVPAVILAPMEGLTDAPMREVQGQIGAFTFAVAEFLRISGSIPSKAALCRLVPELRRGGKTTSGLPVYVQLLGGHPGRMAQAALAACDAGAKVIDINFGCPAPTVNNHDGGAALLKHPRRIREIVAAVRDALPPEIPVSAKLRLGWDDMDAVFENSEMAAQGGASWLTVHARTREQSYRPPVYRKQIRLVRERLSLPIVANGDIWTIEQFRRRREETGSVHFMLGRGAMANPILSHQIAAELGLPLEAEAVYCGAANALLDWKPYLRRLIEATPASPGTPSRYLVARIKQWLKIASVCGDFSGFEAMKRAESVDEIFAALGNVNPVDNLPASLLK